MNTTTCLSIPVPAGLAVAVATPDGNEHWPVVGHQISAHQAGVDQYEFLCRRLNGEVVCLAQSYGAPAGTVDDIVIIGFVQLDT